MLRTFQPGQSVWVVVQFPKVHVCAGKYERFEDGHPHSHIVKVDSPHFRSGVVNMLEAFATEQEARRSAIQTLTATITEMQKLVAELTQ